MLIDGESAGQNVYYQNPQLNWDGKDHFIINSDGDGGTDVFIEDLPNLGDKDFGDVVMHIDFDVTNSIVRRWR